MAIKTKGQLAADLISILTDGGLLTAAEDRTLRQNSYDSLAALSGNNAFVGDQGVTGALSVSGGITPSDLTASKIVLTNASKKLISSAYTEAELLALMASQTAWSSQAFSATDFQASGGGTWTVASGDLNYFKYKIIGKTMFINLQVTTTTISGSPTILAVLLPSSQTAIGFAVGSGFYNASGDPINVYVDHLGTYLSISRPALAAFTNGTNDQSFYLSIALEIQ